MGKERARVSFDDDETQIDLEELAASTHKKKPTAKQQNAITREAEKTGFVSRQPKKRRKVSPYTAQFGGKCREGMKDLFQDIGSRLDKYDTETLELAILALIEKENLKDLKEKYFQITKR